MRIFGERRKAGCWVVALVCSIGCRGSGSGSGTPNPTALSGEPAEAPGNSATAPGEPTARSGEPAGALGNSATAAVEATGRPGEPAGTPGNSATAAGEAAARPGEPAGALGNSATATARPGEPAGVPRVPAARAINAPRLVILGFDGVDPRRVELLVRAGRLPHIGRLGSIGHRGPLATTNPPQSPVAWAAFATGAAAGEHGIFDFVGRDARTYLPRVATTQVQHAHLDGAVITPATALNLRRGAAFWDVIAGHGVPARALMVPYAYPPVRGGARAVSGLGTPDVRGTNSSYTLLTTDPRRVGAPPPAGGQVAALTRRPGGGWVGALAGPQLTVDGAPVRPTVAVNVRAVRGGLEVQVGATRQRLGAGETGAMFTVDFVAHPRMAVAAATQLTVRAVRPPEIYVAPLGVLPARPYLPLSEPPAYAQGLWEMLGAFKTVGWVDDTSALGGGVMDDAQFLREAQQHTAWTARALEVALAEANDRLVIAVFTAPDRIAHMFYRATDAAHPAYTAAAARFAGAIDDAYAQMDGIVGASVARLRAGDRLLVMSDHGFAAFSRGVHLNRWLIEHGYLALRPGVRTPRDFFADVDWSRTRAYAFGTGGIYLNLRGREAQGIVEPLAASALATQLAREIEGLRDGATAVVPRAYLGDALYAGPARADAPDVRVAMAPGYRASWATTLGGMPAGLFEDNRRAWSGDHASSEPADVPGILLSNVPLRDAPPPRIEDIAASAYAFAAVAPPATCRGRPLWAPAG